MAVKTKDELMGAIRARIGEDKSDEAISLVEDISDTFDDFQSKATSDGTDWKAKYEENDATWRQKYRDRFFNNSDTKDDEMEDEGEEIKTLTYDELFKEES